MKKVLLALFLIIVLGVLVNQYVNINSETSMNNPWIFSYVYLADSGMEQNYIENTFDYNETIISQFDGLSNNLYIGTLQHIWKGLFIHPLLLVILSEMTSIDVITLIGIPLTIIIILILLFFLSKKILNSEIQALFVVFLLAFMPYQFHMNTSTLTISFSLVLVLILIITIFYLFLKKDIYYLLISIMITTLIFFWYYTSFYFIITLLFSYLLYLIYSKKFKESKIMFLSISGFVIFFLVVLISSGLIQSHINLLSFTEITSNENGFSDATSYLYNSNYESFLLYLQLTIFLIPIMIYYSLLIMARYFNMNPLKIEINENRKFLLYIIGVTSLLFCSAMFLLQGMSFLNRIFIFLGPVWLIIFVDFFFNILKNKKLFFIIIGLLFLVSLLLFSNTQIDYGDVDMHSFSWIDKNIDRISKIYSQMEVDNILFGVYGYYNLYSENPTKTSLNEIYYQNSYESLKSYILDTNYFIIRDEIYTSSFTQFGSLLKPISYEDYMNYNHYDYMNLVYNNENNFKIYQVTE